MAEPLKNSFGEPVVRELARQIRRVHKPFRIEAFVESALRDFEAASLMARGDLIAQALRAHLPNDYPAALDILLRSADEPRGEGTGDVMASFFYLPHTRFVALFGLGYFESSMHAQHALTQRFTAEFSIRAFLEQHPERTLARLHEWTTDPSEHVRRLVSEGTRPRLPWAMRLRGFQRDPRPVLELLERLKDDPSEYVRRSVANNLNDIGKDHPDLLARVARRWLRGAGPERRRLVRHALRSALKRSDAGALAASGYDRPARVTLANAAITPRRAPIGGKVTISFDVVNTLTKTQSVLVDFQIFFVKAGGGARPKVFKLRELELAPRQSQRLKKTVSLAQLTTRRHYPGRHRVEVLLNGRARPLGEFTLVKPG